LQKNIGVLTITQGRGDAIYFKEVEKPNNNELEILLDLRGSRMMPSNLTGLL